MWIQAIQELDVYLSLTVQDVCVLYDPKEAWLGAKDTNRMFDAVADFLLLKNEITDQQKTLSVSAAVIIKKVTEVRQKGQKRRR